jgi:hypothetical protein
VGIATKEQNTKLCVVDIYLFDSYWQRILVVAMIMEGECKVIWRMEKVGSDGVTPSISRKTVTWSQDFSEYCKVEIYL